MYREMVPFGYEFEEEEPPIIEGEFREVPSEEETGPGFFERMGGRLAERAKEREERERLRKWARARRGYPEEPSGMVRGARGLIRAIVPQKTRLRELEGYYLPRVKREFYLPSKEVRKLHELPRRMPAKEALTPRLEALRRKGELEAKPTELDLSQLKGRLTFANLQMGMKPAGWTDIEWACFMEIRSNDDIDTMEHVTEEVGKMFPNKRAVTDAIQKLIKRGVVYEDKSFPGEPILRVVPRR